MSGERTRIQWVDTAKYICMMWVMLSHLESDTDLLRSVYRPFALNGFYFAAGYVYVHRKGFRSFLAKKVKGLLLPWLFFSVFNIALAQLFSFGEHASMAEELKWAFLQIRELDDSLWFLTALFMAFIPFYFFVDYAERRKQDRGANTALLLLALCLSVLSSLYSAYMDPELLPWGKAALPWHIEIVFVAMFWMAVGYFFRRGPEIAFDQKGFMPYKLLGLAGFLALRGVPYFCGFSFENRLAEMAYDYASAFLGVFCLVCAAKAFRPGRYMRCIGRNTLICFVVHGKIYSVMQTMVKRMAGGPYAAILGNELASSLYSVLFTVVLSVVLLVPIYVINQWFPFLIGKSVRMGSSKE